MCCVRKPTRATKKSEKERDKNLALVINVGKRETAARKRKRVAVTEFSSSLRGCRFSRPSETRVQPFLRVHRRHVFHILEALTRESSLQPFILGIANKRGRDSKSGSVFSFRGGRDTFFFGSRSRSGSPQVLSLPFSFLTSSRSYLSTSSRCHPSLSKVNLIKAMKLYLPRVPSFSPFLCLQFLPMALSSAESTHDPLVEFPSWLRFRHH